MNFESELTASLRTRGNLLALSLSKYCNVSAPARAVLQFMGGISKAVQGGFYFHPTDEEQSVGTPDRKKPLSGRGFVLRQLENRCAARMVCGSGLIPHPSCVNTGTTSERSVPLRAPEEMVVGKWQRWEIP